MLMQPFRLSTLARPRFRAPRRKKYRVGSSLHPIDPLMSVHVEEAASLFELHAALQSRASVSLLDFDRLHERLAGHVDGLLTAGEGGWRQCEAALAQTSAGAAQVSAIWALHASDATRLDELCARAASDPRVRDELARALSWVDKGRLRGVVAGFLKSDDESRRVLALDACVAHHVDPGGALTQFVLDASPVLRARALRAAGELGRIDLLPACVAALDDPDEDCRAWAAWAAVLLGDRHRALRALVDLAQAPGEHQERSLVLALQASSVAAGATVLGALNKDASNLRRVVRGAGIVGDAAYVPWLISQMTEAATARAAGEAFALIVGADLSRQMEAEPPDGFESGPSDTPDDEDVAVDPDEGLPWPDVPQVQRRWAAQSGQFGTGQRYFVGAPVTRAHCVNVLAHGYQRQRVLAAHHLCLLEPGTPLFNTGAPAWRQRRWLGRMG